MRKRILGGSIQASDTPDFMNAKTIYTIDTLDIPDKIPLDGGSYRYWRYLSPNGSYGSIAELRFLNSDSIKINGTPISSTGTITDAVKNAFDGDWLSNFETGSADGNWVGMDFGKPTSIGFVRIVPRGDDNDIHPGDIYELKYWDGYYWVTHQISKAEDNSLHYENIPSGTLLWLHNRSRGLDERIFRFNNGILEWW